MIIGLFRDDLLNYTHFCTSASRIIKDLFFGRNYRFFGVFCKLRFHPYLPSDFIDLIFEILREKLFHETILQWMKSNNEDDSSRAKQRKCLRERIFDMSEFIIDEDAECLEDTKWWFLIEAWRFDNFEKLESRIDIHSLSDFHYLWSDEPRFLLFTIESEYPGKFWCIKSHDHIWCCLPFRSIKTHIKWSVKTQRKTSIRKIKMDTTHTQIIEYKIYTFNPNFYKLITERCEALRNKFFFDIWCFIFKIFFRTIEILSISIKSDKYTIFHIFAENTSMTSQTKCSIYNNMWWKRKSEIYISNRRKKYWCMQERKQEKIWEYK